MRERGRGERGRNGRERDGVRERVGGEREGEGWEGERERDGVRGRERGEREEKLAHQNLNSGSLLMKGLNSSLLLVGNCGPSSEKRANSCQHTCTYK